MAAFLGSVITLVLVASQGAIIVRFYDPSSIVNLALPFGFHIDRLSAVMMVPDFGGRRDHLSLFDQLHVSGSRLWPLSRAHWIHHLRPPLHGVERQPRHARLCFGNSSVIRSPCLRTTYAMPPRWRGRFEPSRSCASAMWRFLPGLCSRIPCTARSSFTNYSARAADNPIMLSPFPGIEISGPTAVTLLIFIGAMSKSAQFPLHIWLPRSLYAPTPVHALLHAGIINAGGFLINRLAPLYGLSSITLHVAFVIGTLTAMLGASMMLTQNDIKKTLGFSTIGQMGYMIMECGLGAFALAVFHLIAHGLFKATVFLNCGNVIHKARQEPLFPPSSRVAEEMEFSRLAWSTGFFTTLLMPLTILLVAHGALQIPIRDSQGAVIFLFFIWVTSSQAILTLTRLRAVASWKVSAAMLLTLLFVVFTYLFAAERFTAFLYPDREEVAVVFPSGRPSRPAL